MMHAEIREVPDVPAAFAETVADAFMHRTNADRFSIAFSGGSSARPCYEALARTTIEWGLVTALWGDDRLVPLDHADSNYLATRQTLFDHVDPLAAIHPMYSAPDASAYEALVAELAPLDVIHLGMGPDGHTASLFPGSPDLVTPEGRLVVDTGDDLHPHPRRTLTFEGIRNSRLVIFTVSGESKRDMFRRIKAGEDYPATRVQAGRVIWLVDEAANA